MEHARIMLGFFVCVALVAITAVTARSEELEIQKFLTDPIVTFDASGKPTGEVSTGSLGQNIPVTKRNERGLVSFTVDGREVWVDELDVELSDKKTGKAACVGGGFSVAQRTDYKSLAPLGAGSDCR